MCVLLSTLTYVLMNQKKPIKLDRSFKSLPIHWPKSALASNPSTASDSNLASTCFHSSSASLAPVVLLMNLRPLRARCAIDLVRWSLAFSFLSSRAGSARSTESDEAAVLEDDDLISRSNVRRMLRDVADRLRPKIPVPASSSDKSFGTGVTLYTTMSSSSSLSSNMTSTKSWLWWLPCLVRSLRNIGSIAPPTNPFLESSSGKEVEWL